MHGQVVDTPSATEFFTEIQAKLLPGAAADFTRLLGEKSARVGQLLAHLEAATGEQASREVLEALLRTGFATRRRAGQILASVPPVQLRAAILRLVAPGADLESSFAELDELLEEFPGAAFDLPGELLHFGAPQRYWLWSRWVWDPELETGALRLVTTEEVELAGPTRAATYRAVGEATAFVLETGRAAGFLAGGEDVFAVDVFLAAVYGVYMYTVLRMRMTREFTRIVPELPELVRRLLGIYHGYPVTSTQEG